VEGRISRFEIDDTGRYLLVNAVETYVDLDDEAREEYARLLRRCEGGWSGLAPWPPGI
jgi:hypothetical protein